MMRSSKTLWDQLDKIIRDMLAPADYEITKPKTMKRPLRRFDGLKSYRDVAKPAVHFTTVAKEMMSG
jgi:hypothetical protein